MYVTQPARMRVSLSPPPLAQVVGNSTEGDQNQQHCGQLEDLQVRGGDRLRNAKNPSGVLMVLSGMPMVREHQLGRNHVGVQHLHGLRVAPRVVLGVVHREEGGPNDHGQKKKRSQTVHAAVLFWLANRAPSWAPKTSGMNAKVA